MEIEKSDLRIWWSVHASDRIEKVFTRKNGTRYKVSVGYKWCKDEHDLIYEIYIEETYTVRGKFGKKKNIIKWELVDSSGRACVPDTLADLHKRMIDEATRYEKTIEKEEREDQICSDIEKDIVHYQEEGKLMLTRDMELEE